MFLGGQTRVVETGTSRQVPPQLDTCLNPAGSNGSHTARAMVSSELYAGGWQLLEWIGDEYPAHAVARGRASDKRGWAARPSLLQRASGTAPLRGGAACHGAASRRHILKLAVHSPAPRSGACRTPPRFEPQVWSVGAPRPTFARCRRYQGVLTGLGACRVLGSPVAIGKRRAIRPRRSQ